MIADNHIGIGNTIWNLSLDTEDGWIKRNTRKSVWRVRRVYVEFSNGWNWSGLKEADLNKTSRWRCRKFCSMEEFISIRWVW